MPNESNIPAECQACGGSLAKEEVNLEDLEDGKLYLMEKIPGYVCQSCGEIWIPEAILKDFEKMIDLAQKRRTKKKRKKKK